MRIRVAARTDRGRVRERNEDGYLVQEPLFAVADGMGGHRGGDVASSMVLEALRQLELAGDGALQALVEEIKRANADVLNRGESDQHLRGMGTTLTALLADGEKAHVAHVGDSRAYLLRDGGFQQLTIDHTLVERMVQEGRLEPNEARSHPQRSVLTRALGVDLDLSVDALTLPLQGGDRVLLCTDGLTGMVEEEEIRRILEEERDLEAACERLVEAALVNGGDDNVTVVVLDVENGGGGGSPDTMVVGPGRPAPAEGADRSRSNPATGSRPTTAGTPSGFAGSGTVDPAAPEPGAGEPQREAGTERGRGLGRRVAVWAAVAVALIVVGILGIRLYLDQQWYVGVAGDRVAIYNGIPTDVLGLELSDVRETTDLPAAGARRLQPWRGVDEGITASSLDDARAIVSQMRSDVEAAEAEARRPAARERSGGGA